MLHSRQLIVTLIALMLATTLAGCGAPGAAETARGEESDATPTAGATDLAGTSWVLTSLNGDTPVEDSTVTLTFSGQDAGGDAGCNSYTAAYTYTDNTFSFAPPVSTMMACNDPAGIMEQEQRYLDVLQNATAYQLDGDQLRLETGDGRALIFAAQE